MSEFLLIDGYNLLHAAGIIPRGIGPGTLERARTALLNYLAAAIGPEQLPRTTIVFDAAERLPELPRTTEHSGMKVHFAAGYADADTLIEELIRGHSAPRQLTVVSSDHQVQRAARRRRARSVDSDVWFAGVAAQRRSAQQPGTQAMPARPPVPLLKEDVEYWIRWFGGEEAIAESLRAESTPQPPGAIGPRAGKSVPPADHSLITNAESLANPFPEGYGEDLLDDDAEWLPPGSSDERSEDS